MNEMRLEIYPRREETFRREMRLLKKSKISSQNKELIVRFQNYLFGTNSQFMRVAKLSGQLRRLCAVLSKDLDQLERRDLEELLATINNGEGFRHYAEASKSDYRRLIRQFYRWFRDEDPRLKDSKRKEAAESFYKFIQKEMKIGYKVPQADPKSIIDESDIQQVLENGCRNARDKAFISVLHESGFRAGEILNLRVADVTFKKNYCEIVCDGKTGRRIVSLVKSIPNLLRYLENHPYKKNAQSFLWLSNANHNLHEPLLHKGAQKLVDEAFKRAGITKRHNLHWFRHSRATLLAPKLTEQILCKFMGWRIGSQQPRTYSHLSVEQINDAILSIHGLKKEEDKTDTPIKCICDCLNNPNERYCYKCHRPLTVATIVQDKEVVDTEINVTIKLMMEMLKDPKVMAEFEAFKKRQQ